MPPNIPDTMEISCFTSPPREITNFWRQYSDMSTSGGKKLENSQKKHRLLYKTPPNWLQTYRNKCLDAISQRRQDRHTRLLESFRKIDLDHVDDDCENSKDATIRDVMSSVWRDCQFTIDYDTFWNDYECYLKDLETELLQDDQNDYFDDLWDDVNQKELDWVIENQYSVTCFACQKSPLSLIHNSRRTQVICQHCKFAFMTDFQLSSEHFCTRFNQIIDQHSIRCSHLFQFELLNNPANNVKFECKHCNFSSKLFFGHF